ncbi:hypothetical protein CERSUDRAFT_98104 [Gelatoporia subvermispora B]|uniref:NAD-dependent epimerase/dehydratase domain-containing protein n=1 Tax=Ceriporiopsis subvermispora (strain B) TaxID=914234 RepID=M2QB03_CERS8|nr:hypothetical protein CERSUDRAFT_98104 [Gelatoporia subvermispora B]
MSQGKIPILLIGASGYIGGSVLTRFLQSPDFPKYDITVYLRSEEKAQKLQQFGVRPLLGDLQDADKLASAASQAHVVVNCADADDFGAACAIIDGLRKRHEETEDVPILIHTSGTGVLADNAAGMHPTSTIYSDMDPEQIGSLSPSQPHREVDLAVIDADAKGYLQAYFVLPSTIYGLASGPLADAGIMNIHSQQIPTLIKSSLDRGAAGMVGEGKNIWPSVHIDEVADLFFVVFENAIAGKKIGHGNEGFYFGENGEHTLYEVGRGIGAALVELGKIKNPEPTTFTKEEIDKYFGGNLFMGSNSRCRGERSRAIGWKPVKLTKDMLASIKPEMESMINHPETVKF